MGKPRNERMEIAAQCRLLIEEHLFDDDFTLEKAAAHFGYSVSGFRYLITENSEYTFHVYVRLRRIHKAAQLLRKGGTLEEAAVLCKYGSVSGFCRAFMKVYGVSAQDYMRTKGVILMRSPTIEERKPFSVVGYAFKARDGLLREESGGYWVGQIFSDVPNDFYARTLQGGYSAGIWTKQDENDVYIFGPAIEREREVFLPESWMRTDVPGGKYARFYAPPADNNSQRADNIQATWYYACKQWIPSSGYAIDHSRTGFELYAEDTWIMLPVKRGEKPNRNKK